MVTDGGRCIARRVSLIFGALTMASGMLGVPLGAWLGAALVKRWGRAHAVICGVGLLLSTPAMALAMLLTDNDPYAPFVLMFFGELALNLNWALVADMSLVRTRYGVPDMAIPSRLMFNDYDRDCRLPK